MCQYSVTTLVCRCRCCWKPLTGVCLEFCDSVGFYVGQSVFNRWSYLKIIRLLITIWQGNVVLLDRLFSLASLFLSILFHISSSMRRIPLKAHYPRDTPNHFNRWGWPWQRGLKYSLLNFVVDLLRRGFHFHWNIYDWGHHGIPWVILIILVSA